MSGIILIIIIFMHWLLDPLQKHYADFEGRIGLQEFWMYTLFIFAINVVLGMMPFTFFLANIVSLGFLVPNIAMGTRRLHDTGRSGWWFAPSALVTLLSVVSAIALALFSPVVLPSLISGMVAFSTLTLVFGFLMLVYTVVLIILLCQPGQIFDNEYGVPAKPKVVATTMTTPEPTTNTLSAAPTDPAIGVTPDQHI